MAAVVTANSFWSDKAIYDDAEKVYYEKLAKLQNGGIINVSNEKGKKSKSKKKVPNNNNNDENKIISTVTPQVSNGPEKKESKKNKNKNKSGNSVGGGGCQQKSSLANEVAKAREKIKMSLESVNLAEKTGGNSSCQCLGKEKFAAMEQMINSLVKSISSLESELSSLKISVANSGQPAPAKAAPAPSKPAKDDDDDVDLFGSESEEEDEEAKQLKEKRLAEYAAKKSKKPALIAKSSIILDVKPWDDETDMKALESAVRAIEMDGLLWGASKLVPLAYGIHKLQITCVVEDDKVSIDLLNETIEAIDELVQSVDIAAFNKI